MVWVNGFNGRRQTVLDKTGSTMVFKTSVSGCPDGLAADQEKIPALVPAGRLPPGTVGAGMRRL